ncbi:GroES-like protein [Xylariaceae sp. FL1019]|nr:GroES-like protein [Xylariaceae sp. FL1019]
MFEYMRNMAKWSRITYCDTERRIIRANSHHMTSTSTSRNFQDLNSLIHNMAGAKALLVQSIKSPPDIAIIAKDIPTAVSGTAVVRVLCAGIGPGHGYLLSHEVPRFSFPVPCVYGSNAVGRIVSVGSDAVSLKAGQLVLVDNFTVARDDPDAEIIVGLMDGGSPKSRKLAEDAWRDGTWQTHTVVPLENTIALDEDLLLGKLGYEIEDLAILQRLAVAYGGISNIDVKAGETVIVGPATGQFSGAAVEVAAAAGARVIALGRNEAKLAELKAHIPRVETVVITGDVAVDAAAIQVFGLADAFIDFTPHAVDKEPSHIESAILSLRKRGRVALMGGTSAKISLPYLEMVTKSLEIKAKWMYTRPEIRRLVKMVETGLLKIGKGAGHQVLGRFKLEEWEKAFEEAPRHTGWGTNVIFTP